MTAEERLFHLADQEGIEVRKLDEPDPDGRDYIVVYEMQETLDGALILVGAADGPRGLA